MLTDQAVQTLTSAGLTTIQAKIYFALVKSGKADTKKLATAENLDRSNVYKTIESLQKLGLIEEIVGTPHYYIAIPIEYALTMLIKKQAENCAELEKKANLFLQKYAIQQNQLPDKEYFTIIPGKQAMTKKWEKTLPTVQHSVDLIATERREPDDEPIWDIYRCLLRRGIKVRWILDRSNCDDKEFNLRVKEFEHLFEFPNLELRTIFSAPKPYGITCDNKFAVYFLDPTPCVKHSRSLWTNNPEMIETFKQHFEAIWQKSQIYEPKRKQLEKTSLYQKSHRFHKSVDVNPAEKHN